MEKIRRAFVQMFAGVVFVNLCRSRLAVLHPSPRPCSLLAFFFFLGNVGADMLARACYSLRSCGCEALISNRLIRQLHEV